MVSTMNYNCTIHAYGYTRLFTTEDADVHLYGFATQVYYDSSQYKYVINQSECEQNTPEVYNMKYSDVNKEYVEVYREMSSGDYIGYVDFVPGYMFYVSRSLVSRWA